MTTQSRVNKLVGQGTDALGDGVESASTGLLEKHGRIGLELLETLRIKNGFYAFASALHVLPLATYASSATTLETWNDPKAWACSYGSLIQGAPLFFAEDVFGGQFCITGEVIARFDPETGKFQGVASGVDEWAGLILEDRDFQTGFPLAEEWASKFGPIPVGQRLLPKKPFLCGGDFAVSNLFLMDATRGMRLRGEIAQQIALLPDGTEIEIEYA